MCSDERKGFREEIFKFVVENIDIIQSDASSSSLSLIEAARNRYILKISEPAANGKEMTFDQMDMFETIVKQWLSPGFIDMIH